MLRQMSVNLAKFDTETTNFDLIVCSAAAFNVTIRHISTKITRAVHAVSGSLVELSPCFVLSSLCGKLFVLLCPSLVVNKPVLNELGVGKILELHSEIALGQTASSNVNLANLSNRALSVFVIAVNNEQLHINHTGTGWNDLSHLFEEVWVLGLARDLVETDSSLSLSCAVHVLDADVGCKLLKSAAISLEKNVTNKECTSKRRHLWLNTTQKDLSHGRSKMSDSDLILASPLGQSVKGDVFRRRHNQLGTQEQWGEDITLNWVVCNTTQHGETIVLYCCQQCSIMSRKGEPYLGKSESLLHPGEVVCQREMTSLDTLWSAFGAGSERKSRD